VSPECVPGALIMPPSQNNPPTAASPSSKRRLSLVVSWAGGEAQALSEGGHQSSSNQQRLSDSECWLPCGFAHSPCAERRGSSAGTSDVKSTSRGRHRLY